MRTFKEYYSEEIDPSEAPREPTPELQRGLVRVKSQELMALRDQIMQHRAAAATGETTPLSQQEIDALKAKVSQLAGELEGSRLPMDAEEAASDAYRALVGMAESANDESIRSTILETSEMLKSLISEEILQR